MNGIYNIGVLIGNANSQHPKELIQGIYEAATEENVNITMFLGTQGNSLGYDKEISDHGRDNYNYQFNVVYDYALLANLDALIISYGTLCIFLEEVNKNEFLKKYGDIPTIILEEYEDNKEASYLISDNYGSMMQIMEHMIIDHGYHNILHLSGPLNNCDATERRQAYLDAMAKHHLPVTEQMIIYGDYSTDVDHLVEKLLDDNPEAEAIVSANDEMTVSIYRVCKKRGLVVGKDLAVTGYDDADMARKMDPPLTTANQDGVDMGFLALKQAVMLCKGDKHVALRIPAKFKKRGSCGCAYCTGSIQEIYKEVAAGESNRTSLYIQPEMLADYIIQRSVNERRNKEIDQCFKNLLYDLGSIILYNHEEKKDEAALESGNEQFLNIVRKVLEKRYSRYVDVTRFTESIHEILREEMKYCEEKERLLWLHHLMEITDEYIQSLVLLRKSEQINELFYKSWMAPVMVREMMEQVADETQFYNTAIKQIRARGAKSAYLYILEDPITYLRGESFLCPEKMYLAAQYKDGEIVAYPPSERPVITRKNGFNTHYSQIEGHIYITFTLFVDETQFGVMICEISDDEMGDFYGISLQIGTALAFLKISMKEADAKRQLYTTMKTLEDKNEILNFVSTNDELTGIYNRRGFMEHAMELARTNAGKEAYMIFADLDHLKEINDCFGHAEGDFAISHAAKILSAAMGDKGYCGRIGGDEFVAMILAEHVKAEESIKEEFKKAIDGLNETSGKPYYVEFSVGIIKFMCETDSELSSIIKGADDVLYVAKKNRRKSIKRE